MYTQKDGMVHICIIRLHPYDQTKDDLNMQFSAVFNSQDVGTEQQV